MPPFPHCSSPCYVGPHCSAVLWNQDSLWYGVRVVQSTLQALFRSTIARVVVQEALLYLLLTRVIWSSHADLFGSGPHKLIALPLTLSRHSCWRQCHAATSIISLRLGSSASLSSPFSSFCTLLPTVQPFCPASLFS